MPQQIPTEHVVPLGAVADPQTCAAHVATRQSPGGGQSAAVEQPLEPELELELALVPAPAPEFDVLPVDAMLVEADMDVAPVDALGSPPTPPAPVVWRPPVLVAVVVPPAFASV